MTITALWGQRINACVPCDGLVNQSKRFFSRNEIRSRSGRIWYWSVSSASVSTRRAGALFDLSPSLSRIKPIFLLSAWTFFLSFASMVKHGGHQLSASDNRPRCSQTSETMPFPDTLVGIGKHLSNRAHDVGKRDRQRAMWATRSCPVCFAYHKPQFLKTLPIPNDCRLSESVTSDSKQKGNKLLIVGKSMHGPKEIYVYFPVHAIYGCPSDKRNGVTVYPLDLSAL